MDNSAYVELMQVKDIHTFVDKLATYPCQRCSLSQRSAQKVIYRGNLNAKIVLVGEAPGLVEEQQGLPFVGPAGQLGDKIFESIGLDTNKDMWLSNICLCRPAAPEGSGKQNYTPIVEQKQRCMPYILKMIGLTQPKVVILAGLTAAQTLLGKKLIPNMKSCAGKFIDIDSIFGTGNTKALTKVFVMYHPAYVIHAQKGGPEKAQEARRAMWEHMQILRDGLEEEKNGTEG